MPNQAGSQFQPAEEHNYDLNYMLQNMKEINGAYQGMNGLLQEHTAHLPAGILPLMIGWLRAQFVR